MKRLILLAVCILALTACVGKGASVQYSGTDKYAPEYLFTVEGVKVFRFSDGGSLHYLSIPSGGATTTRTVYTGKSYYHVDDVIKAGRL